MSEMEQIMLSLKNVSKTFYMREEYGDTLKGKLFNLIGGNKARELKALQDVNLEIKKGECFGIVGRNGSGKSTLTKLMAGTFLPDAGGEVIIGGTVMLLNLGLGMSHELSARDNIYVTSSLLGISRKQTDELFDKIIEFAGLEEFIDTKLKYYSTGMKQRLAFSIAVNANADIIFLDEVFAVGDAQFKEKATQVFEQAFIDGKTVVMVSHSLNNITKYCQRAALIDKGKVLFVGDSEEVVRRYRELVATN